MFNLILVIILVFSLFIIFACFSFIHSQLEETYKKNNDNFETVITLLRQINSDQHIVEEKSKTVKKEKTTKKSVKDKDTDISKEKGE